MDQKLKICTYNIRFAEADDKNNAWPYRKDLVIERLKEELPDIIGFQELKGHVKDLFEDTLPYQIIGTGRLEDFSDEHNAIAYKKDRFTLLSHETFWLSDAPYLPGSKYENSDGWPRICTLATFYIKGSKKGFRVFNTHLDHLYKDIRLQQLKVLGNKFAEYNKRFPLPTFITGDLNCTPDSEEIHMILNDYRGKFNDLSTSQMLDKTFTYHDYFNTDNKVKIDYIFATEGIKHLGSYVDDTEKGGIYLSDHYPIYSKVII